MPRRKSRCCPCPGSPSPTPTPSHESPRIVGSHPLQRTSRKSEGHYDDKIHSQMYDPQYADYFDRKAREARTAQALGMMSKRVQDPGRPDDPRYPPPDVLDIIQSYANQKGGKKTRKYKKRSNKKKKRTNRRKTNKRRSNRRK